MNNNLYPTFGEALCEWMDAQQISCHALADKLNIKSATSVSRMRLDRCKLKSCTAFFEKLDASGLLSEKYKARLQTGLDVLSQGREYFDYFSTFDRLIYGKSPSIDTTLPIVRELEALCEAERCEILCLHSATLEVFAAFRNLIEKAKGKVSITHYVSIGEGNSINKFLINASTLMINPCYTPVRLVKLSQFGLAASNFILVRWRIDNEIHHKLILPRDNGNINCCSLDRDSVLYEFFLDVMSQNLQGSNRIGSVFRP